jgi:hypothetical protein
MIGLTVILSHCINPDIAGGYWQHPIDPGKPMHALANSLKQAQTYALRYIERNTLGGGNWSGGELRLDGHVIGRISYNGRAWRMDGAEMFANDPVLGCYAKVRK